MNEEQIKGNWKQFSGKIKEKWGKLTDNDLKEVEGRAEVLAGKIQTRYGKAKDVAQQEVNDFFKDNN
jgi:uncharacterized protein YjbJ (UPF0337 family)